MNGSIRVLAGFLLTAGAIGNDDLAMALGNVPPPIMQTMSVAIVGLLIMLWGVRAMILQENKNR